MWVSCNASTPIFFTLTIWLMWDHLSTPLLNRPLIFREAIFSVALVSFRIYLGFGFLDVGVPLLGFRCGLGDCWELVPIVCPTFCGAGRVWLCSPHCGGDSAGCTATLGLRPLRLGLSKGCPWFPSITGDPSSNPLGLSLGLWSTACPFTPPDLETCEPLPVVVDLEVCVSVVLAVDILHLRLNQSADGHRLYTQWTYPRSTAGDYVEKWFLVTC